MRDRNLLFSGFDWFAIERGQLEGMSKEISAYDADKLLNTSVDDLAKYFEKKFRIDVPELNREEITVDQRETQIDVSGDPRRYISDSSRPCFVPGTLIEVEVPFTGEAGALRIQPTTYSLSPPRAEIRGSSLIIQISGTDLTSSAVQQRINRVIGEIEDNLKNLRINAAGLNSRLKPQAIAAIEARRDKLLSDRNLVGALGFKMKERSGSPRTYTAPNVQRKLTPAPPGASTAAYKPEPVLKLDDYEHILGVIENMAHVMERSPSAFESMDEESLRSHFLVQLNGHYEGQATGETFNYEGKTDILVRADGKNIFIAECKFWGGPKKFTETIDQLLGYAAWRDTKTAIIIFNRNKGLTKVLEAVKDTARSHENYKKDIPGSTETQLRFCFSHRDDPNRELLLAVLVFDVPSSKA